MSDGTPQTLLEALRYPDCHSGTSLLHAETDRGSCCDRCAFVSIIGLFFVIILSSVSVFHFYFFFSQTFLCAIVFLTLIKTQIDTNQTWDEHQTNQILTSAEPELIWNDSAMYSQWIWWCHSHNTAMQVDGVLGACVWKTDCWIEAWRDHIWRTYFLVVGFGRSIAAWKTISPTARQVGGSAAFGR